MITHLIFDWGDTLMRDFTEKPGPMADWDYIEVFPGVIETLQSLQHHFTLAVATNAGFSNTELMRKALVRGGIEHYFSYYFSSKDLGFSKPDVRFFNALSSGMNILPENCFFIGNDYNKDIVGANAIGMKTVLFNHSDTIFFTSVADYIITDFSELEEIMKPFINHS